MADNHSPEIRRKNMSRIKSTNTKPELQVRKFLFSEGFRYRINVSSLPGRPDIVLPKYHTVIFINGCFWHHHDCGRFVWPSSNEDYWRQKINSNVKRDASNIEALQTLGWKVIVIWECQLKKEVRADNLDALRHEIRNGTEKGVLYWTPQGHSSLIFASTDS